MTSFQKALFIFRRDLRLEDNTGLIFALKHAQTVIPAFILTPEQIEHNPYRSNHCLQFMIESLEELNEALQAKGGKLYLFYGHPEQVVESCLQKFKVDVVIVNTDYTPYSLKRDNTMASVCQRYDVPFLSFEDALLHAPEQTLKKDGTPYTIFTPYFRNATKQDVSAPTTNRRHNYFSGSISFAEKPKFLQHILRTRVLPHLGGRKAALHILKNIKNVRQYETLKEYPAQQGTTHLSAHLKFTTCSIREAYHAIVKVFGSDSALIRSLYWRDFFTMIAFYFPHVFTGAFHAKFNRLPWSYSKKAFKRWCEGATGFPLVDAGMRELNATGYMHNRVRLVVASFLVKDLHIDWRWGEKYFAQTLIDYDPAVNNGNWQWAASTGCDAQPYFRIFNPWTQTATYDPDCIYIKKWVPELEALPPKIIKAWYLNKHHALFPSYPPPMVDHAQEAAVAKTTYRRIGSSKG